MRYGLWPEARAHQRRITAGDGLEYNVSTMIGITGYEAGTHPPAGALFPVAFRVDQDPGTTAAPHFHMASQFQVFVEGDGFFGRQPVHGARAQFAQAFTPYGPIVAGERGIAYLTLRDGWDPGGQFLPQTREALHAAKRRPRAALTPQLDVAPVVTRNSMEPVIVPASDGLAGWRHRLTPGQRLLGPDPASGGGQYWVVLAGADTGGETTLAPSACAFVFPDEPAHEAVAGFDGLDVLVLQFPRRTDSAADGG